MALVGGGGAPNVAGSNPAGVGKTLHTIGDFAYAYSGVIQVGTGQTLLEFETGSYLFVGTLQYMVGEDTTDNIVFETSLNGEIVTGSLNETAQAPNPLNPIPMVLPPYSKVSCDGTNFTGGQTGRKCYAVIQGRIYA
tara:strand:+ start:429 stop:839 length:411 start_codon:yes stop_codon:yes gene_type:complete